jgi:phosphoglycerate dehydrogenase-like enzyme
VKVLLMYQPSAQHLSALAEAAPGAEVLVARSEEEAKQLVVDADAILGNRYFLQSLPFARQLRWMQSNSAGTDLILRSGADLQGIVITCARGLYDDEMAEHAVALVLALYRGLHHARDQQHTHRWNRSALHTVQGQRALVLGWGGVGQGIARRLLCLGAAVTGVRRTVRDTREDLIPILGPTEWQHRLPETDLLVLALPLTDETYHLVGEEQLTALARGARVVNVGRGGTLDEDGLLRQVHTGHVAGAALDVLEHEPPAPDHPLWSAPNVLLTPHTGRSLEQPPYRWEPLFVENLRRFSAGAPLLNVVDQGAGY